MTKRFGFTLAEVLITLGIIGVVAAMTIPTLISNTNGAQFKTGFKKALSTLNQAVIMNLAMEDYDFSSLSADTIDNIEAQKERTMGFILGKRVQGAAYDENYSFGTGHADLKWYVDGTAVTGTPEVNSTNWMVYNFADGTSFGFPITAADCTERGKATCVGFIDVNGGSTANPNQVTVCGGSTVEGGTGATKCAVDAAGVKDIFPVFFYGQSIEPASDAAREVLFGK